LSQIVHERSRLVWLHLDKIIKGGGDDSRNLVEKLELLDSNAPFFRRCFTAGVRGASTSDSELMDTMRMFPEVFGEVSPSSKNKNGQDAKVQPRLTIGDLVLPSGCSNAISQAAMLYKTNFLNHFVLVDIVYRKAKRYVRALLFGRSLQKSVGCHDDDDDDEDEEEVRPAAKSEMEKKLTRGQRVYNVLKWVTSDSGDKSSVLPCDMDVARRVRRELGLPEGVELTKAWLKTHLFESLLFGRTVCEYLTELNELPLEEGEVLSKGAARGMRWLPLHAARAHHTNLDSTVLACMFVKTGAIPDEAMEVEEDDRVLVASVLRAGIKAIVGRKREKEFTGTVSTDGVTACIHFRVRKSDVELEAIQKRKTMIQEKAVSKAAAGGLTIRKPKKSVQDQQKESQAKQGSVPEYMVVTDPGRINIACTVVFRNGQLVKNPVTGRPVAFKLTAGKYYTESGVRRRTDEQNRRRSAMSLNVSDVEASLGSVMGADAQKICVHAAALRHHRESVWQFAMARKTRNVKLRNFAGKEKVLAAHWKAVRKGCGAPLKTDVLHVVGAAKVAPNGRGNLSVPTCVAFRVARRAFPSVSPGDEFRTSCACDVCKSDIGCTRMCRDNLADIVSNVKDTPRRKGSKSVAIQWSPLGHQRTSPFHKKQLMIEEERKRGCTIITRYVRGLLTCETGCGKYRDRDVVGAINIGTIFIGDTRGEQRHPAFDRCVPHKPKRQRRGETKLIEGLTT
jgi:hypothetical protein